MVYVNEFGRYLDRIGDAGVVGHNGAVSSIVVQLHGTWKSRC